MSSKCLRAALAVLLVSSAFAAHAQAVTIDVVPVGNPGNPGELSGEGAGGYGEDRIVGSVDYEYSIGKYEVTAGQYCEFLNAVAKTDTYRLCNTYMSHGGGFSGCQIMRSGSSGAYVYTVSSKYANRPVNRVSWYSAARFCNWLHNGQPTGEQDLSTTEDGAYYLNGTRGSLSPTLVSREADWKWAIPTEDEWYKAAYHKNDGPTGNYWDYPTSSDGGPSNKLINPDPGNNANFSTWQVSGEDPYCATEVGAFENSAGPYGTFDQGGNVWEWTEEASAAIQGTVRGGSFRTPDAHLSAAYRSWAELPIQIRDDIGFRVVSIPEPGCVCLLIGGLAVGLGWRRRR